MSAMTNWRDMGDSRAQANGATRSNPTGNAIADQLYQISNRPALMVAVPVAAWLCKARIAEPIRKIGSITITLPNRRRPITPSVMGQRTVSPVAATQSPAQFANNTGLINAACSLWTAVRTGWS